MTPSMKSRNIPSSRGMFRLPLKTVIAVGLLAAGLAACSQEEAPPPAEGHDEHASDAPPAEAESGHDEASSLEAELPVADSLTAGKQIFHVWLGDKGQDDAARKAFDGDGGAKTKFAPLLDEYALEVRPFAAALFRIYVGPVESLQKAQELCAKIKERDSGQFCRPVIN